MTSPFKGQIAAPQSEAYKNRWSRSLQMKLLLKTHLEELDLGEVVVEHPVCDDRKWKFDVAIPERGLAFEIEGGIFVQGAHSRGAHYMSDMEKYNRAALGGWRLLRFTPEQVERGEAKQFVEEYL